MQRKLIIPGLSALVVVTGLALSGCGTDVSEGNLPEGKPTDAAQIKEAQQKVKAGIPKGMYKGAPGAPAPKG
jgi:hypothetical protein